MRVLLFVGAILAFVIGLLWLLVARSAIHEIQSFMLLLIAAVCMSGAGIVEAVNTLKKEVLSQQSARP